MQEAKKLQRGGGFKRRGLVKNVGRGKNFRTFSGGRRRYSKPGKGIGPLISKKNKSKIKDFFTRSNREKLERTIRKEQGVDRNEAKKILNERFKNRKKSNIAKLESKKPQQIKVESSKMELKRTPAPKIELKSSQPRPKVVKKESKTSKIEPKKQAPVSVKKTVIKKDAAPKKVSGDRMPPPAAKVDQTRVQNRMVDLDAIKRADELKKSKSQEPEGPSISDRIRSGLMKGDEAVRNLPDTISKGVSRARKYFGFEHGGRINKLKKKAKHGGALAIMIAPVKTKKMKAVKKGAHGAKVKKAPGGASMKKMSMYEDGGSLKPVPSDNKGLSKLPKKVRNKMGYMKNGGKMSARRKKPTSMSFEKMIEKNDNLNVAKTINQIDRSGMSSDKAKKMIEKLKKRRMMYGGSMKKDDKMLKNGGKITKKQKAEMDAKAKKLQKDSKPKNPLLSTPKVKSSKRGKAVQAKEGPAEKATSGPRLVKYYMSKAGGGMSREQAVAKMVRARTGKIPSDDGKSMVKQPKMMYGGSMKKAMYGAKMKKKAMYGASMKKKAMYGAKMKK